MQHEWILQMLSCVNEDGLEKTQYTIPFIWSSSRGKTNLWWQKSEQQLPLLGGGMKQNTMERRELSKGIEVSYILVRVEDTKFMELYT